MVDLGQEVNDTKMGVDPVAIEFAVQVGQVCVCVRLFRAEIG